MVFPAHLLEQSHHLATRERTRPRQASLRRAVSTAYYAIFHLLIHEATLNWKRASQRDLFARYFEHGKMKNAAERQRGLCDRFLNSNPPPTSTQADRLRKLRLVANVFIESQQLRHSADYDNSKAWTRTDTLDLIASVTAAFKSWQAIREHDDAQAFLISLLGNPRSA